jgi:AraC-like DNA-binding protein
MRLRSFPTRLSPGLGVCLKLGPSHTPVADGRPVEFPAGSVIVRPPGCVWSSPPTAAGFVSIDIGPSLLPAEASYRAMTAYAADRLLALPELVSALAGTTSLLRRQQLVVRLVGAVFREGFGRSAEISQDGMHGRAVRRAREYLIERFAANPSLDDVARHAGANKFVLVRAFRRAFGITPHAFQIQVRLGYARQLLARGTPPDEVAAAVGFADQSHFGRHFKRSMGLTPAAYARQIRRPSL